MDLKWPIKNLTIAFTDFTFFVEIEYENDFSDWRYGLYWQPHLC
jgi:hypothetical protein